MEETTHFICAMDESRAQAPTRNQARRWCATSRLPRRTECERPDWASFQARSPEVGISKVFKGYLNIPTVAQAVGVFVFVRYACERNNVVTQRITALCTAIAPQTFGVHLIHWYVLNLIKRSGMVPIHSIVYRTVGSLLVFCLCILLTWLLRSAISGIRFMSAQRKTEAA